MFVTELQCFPEPYQLVFFSKPNQTVTMRGSPMHLLLVALGIVVYVFFFMGVTDDLTYSAVPI